MDINSEARIANRVEAVMSKLKSRLLQDESGVDSTNSTLSPTTYPPFSDSITNDDPDVDVATDDNDNDDGVFGQEGVKNIGIVFLAAFAVVAMFVAYRSYKVWRMRRERHLMQIQSARADTVLGDMQVSRLDFTLSPVVFLTSPGLRSFGVRGFFRWFRMTMSTKMTIQNYSKF